LNNEEKANKSGESATRLELEQHTLWILGDQLPENVTLRKDTLTSNENRDVGEKVERPALHLTVQLFAFLYHVLWAMDYQMIQISIQVR
jgi:hypothetical protein